MDTSETLAHIQARRKAQVWEVLRRVLIFLMIRVLVGMGLAHVIGAFLSHPWHHPITFAMFSFAAALILSQLQALQRREKTEAERS